MLPIRRDAFRTLVVPPARTVRDAVLADDMDLVRVATLGVRDAYVEEGGTEAGLPQLLLLVIAGMADEIDALQARLPRRKAPPAVDPCYDSHGQTIVFHWSGSPPSRGSAVHDPYPRVVVAKPVSGVLTFESWHGAKRAHARSKILGPRRWPALVRRA